MFRGGLFGTRFKPKDWSQVHVDLHPIAQSLTIAPPDTTGGSSELYENVVALKAIADTRREQLAEMQRGMSTVRTDAEFRNRASELHLDPAFSAVTMLMDGNPMLPRPNHDDADHLHDVRPLVMYTASMDARMLVQAGRRASPVDPTRRIESPACMFGMRCVGNDFQLNGLEPGTRCTFMARLLPGELEAHERDGTIPDRFKLTEKDKAAMASGADPPRDYRPTPCVLCSWRHWAHFYINMQCRGERVNPIQVYPWFGNVVDAPDGYRATVCHALPSAGVTVPIPFLCHDLIRAEKCADGLIRVHTDLMRWHPPNPDTDLPFGHRQFTGVIPPLVARTGNGRRTPEPRRQELYTSQLFLLRSSWPARPLLREAPDSKSRLLTQSVITTSDLLLSPRFLLFSCIRRLASRPPAMPKSISKANTKPLASATPLPKPTAHKSKTMFKKRPPSASKPRITSSSAADVVHPREPLCDLVQKCWPVVGKPNASSIRTKCQQICYPPKQEGLAYKIKHRSVFHLAPLCMTEWVMCFWTGAFRVTQCKDAPPIEADMESKWGRRHDEQIQSDVLDTLFSSKDPRICVTILRCFGVYCIQSTTGASDALDAVSRGAWSAYAKAVGSLSDAYLFPTGDARVSKAYIDMCQRSDDFSKAIQLPGSFWTSMASILLPSRDPNVREPIPEGGIELQSTVVAATGNAHPVDAWIRSVLSFPLVPTSAPAADSLTLIRPAWRHEAIDTFTRLEFIWKRMYPQHVRGNWDRWTNDLALVILVFYSLHVIPETWSHALVSLCRDRRDMGEYIANVASQMLHTFSVQLPFQYQCDQLHAAHARFKHSTAFGARATTTWPTSQCVRQYALPPIDMLVLCPRCHAPRCHVNQFVPLNSTKIKMHSPESVAGFEDILVHSPHPMCYRRANRCADACMNTPLFALPVLGKLQFYRGRSYFLCPQPGCCMLAELNDAMWPTLYPTNEKGQLICSWCFSQRVLKEEDAFDAQCRR